jgi:hypothetical protein
VKYNLIPLNNEDMEDSILFNNKAFLSLGRMYFDYLEVILGEQRTGHRRIFNVAIAENFLQNGIALELTDDNQ